MAMSNNQLEVIVDDERWPAKLEGAEEWAAQVFATTLAYLEAENLSYGIGFNKPICVNLALSNNLEVQKLNADFRGKNQPTNVLSFANVDDDQFMEGLEAMSQVELGDIIIALETLEDEALQKGLLLRNHFAHLLVHGLLHLFGYDHQDDIEAEAMEEIEVEILQKLEINNPYEEQ